jgi:imidazolonepropionase-like amidohydrolase
MQATVARQQSRKRRISLRNPYPGKLGVVEQGALADLLVVDGNALENLDLVADPAARFLVIMKDGRIYKNTIPK